MLPKPCLPNGPFPSGFMDKILNVFTVSHTEDKATNHLNI
jgi:hypothetical protein